MAEKFFSERNLRFTLYDVHDVASLCGAAYYADHGKETFEILLDTAKRIATEHLYPYYTEMDRNPPRFEDGRIIVHPSVGEYLRVAGEGDGSTRSFRTIWEASRYPRPCSSPASS